MAKVHYVKSARKEYKDIFTGETIKVGESYYWWIVKSQGKQISKNPPKHGQLTQSEFLRTVYNIQEEIDTLDANEKIIDKLDEIKNKIEALKEETNDKVNNIPINLQNSETAKLLQSRVNSLQEWYDNLEGIDTDIDSELSDEGKKNKYQEIIDEIRAYPYDEV